MLSATEIDMAEVLRNFLKLQLVADLSYKDKVRCNITIVKEYKKYFLHINIIRRYQHTIGSESSLENQIKERERIMRMEELIVEGLSCCVIPKVRILQNP